MAAFIMAGPLQALCFVVLFALAGLFIPLIGLLSSAALALITLRLGWQKSVRTALPAALILTVLSVVLTGSLSPSLLSGLIQWLLVIALASQLQRSSSWRQVFTYVFGIAAVGVLLFRLLIGDADKFWQELMLPLAETALVKQQFPGVDLAEIINAAAGMATGMVAMLLSLGLILALMVGRHWQAILYNPGGFRQEIRELRLSRTLGLAMMALLTAGLLTGLPLLIDVVLAGLAVFLFQGIALVNGIHYQREMHRGWLIGFYVLLALMPLRFGLLLAVFGIVDSVADFRRYLKPRA